MTALTSQSKPGHLISNTSFENLKAIQTAASNATVKIADNGSATGSVIDLKQFSTVEGLKSFTVEGDGGANIIQLSSALSTSGITSVDLGDDDKVDKLFFNVDSTAYLSTGSDSLGYTTVNNFDATGDKDDIGIFYGSDSAIASIKRTGATGDGVQSMTQDRTILEDDTNLVVTNNPSGSSAFDTVDEAKSIIAQAINSVENGPTVWPRSPMALMLKPVLLTPM